MVLKGNKAASRTHTAQPDACVPSSAFAEHLLCAGPALRAEHRLRTRSVLSPVWWGKWRPCYPVTKLSPSCGETVGGCDKF